MRELAELLPSLDSSRDWSAVISFLSEQQIHHDITLAFTNKALDSVAEAAEAQDIVLRFLAAPAETADQVVKARQERSSPIKSPIPCLNELLHGGWPVGQLSTIAAAQATGKTLLALNSVLQFLIDHPDANALWIDTEGAFQPDRAYACAKTLVILKSQSFQSPAYKVRDADVLLVLDRLHHSSALDIPAVVDAVQRFYQKQRIEVEGRHPEPSFIVVDSVSAVFKDKLNLLSSQGTASMVSLLRLLRSVAQDPLSPSVILLVNTTVSSLPTNSLSAFANVKHKAALGKTFMSLMDNSILLSRAEDVLTSGKSVQGEIIAELTKCKNHPARHWCLFKSDGISMYQEQEGQHTGGNTYQANLGSFVR